jgi:hypothetical protein
MSAQPAPAGRISVVTDKPVEVEEHPGAVASAWAEIRRRPWVCPALILGVVVAYLLLRRR